MSRILGPTLREEQRSDRQRLGAGAPDTSQPPPGAVVWLPSTPESFQNDLSVSLGDLNSAAQGLSLINDQPWIQGEGTWTITFWFKDIQAWNYWVLGEYAFNTSGATTMRWALTMDFSNVKFSVSNGSTYESLTRARDPGSSVNTWRFVHIEIDTTGTANTRVRTWRPGNIWTSWISGTFPLTANTDGFKVGGTSFFNSGGQKLSIDSLNLWDRALSTEEIDYLYNAGSGRVYADLIADDYDLSDLRSWYDFGRLTGFWDRMDSHGVWDLQVDAGTFTDAVAITGIAAGQARPGDPVTKWVGHESTTLDATVGDNPNTLLAVQTFRGCGVRSVVGNSRALDYVYKSNGVKAFFDDVVGAEIPGWTIATRATRAPVTLQTTNYLNWGSQNHLQINTTGRWEFRFNSTDIGAILARNSEGLLQGEYVRYAGSMNPPGSLDVEYRIRAGEFQTPVADFNHFDIPHSYGGLNLEVDGEQYEALMYPTGLSVADLDQLNAYISRYDEFDPYMVPGLRNDHAAGDGTGPNLHILGNDDLPVLVSGNLIYFTSTRDPHPSDGVTHRIRTTLAAVLRTDSFYGNTWYGCDMYAHNRTDRRLRIDADDAHPPLGGRHFLENGPVAALVAMVCSLNNQTETSDQYMLEAYLPSFCSLRFLSNTGNVYWQVPVEDSSGVIHNSTWTVSSLPTDTDGHPRVVVAWIGPDGGGLLCNGKASGTPGNYPSDMVRVEASAGSGNRLAVGNRDGAGFPVRGSIIETHMWSLPRRYDYSGMAQSISDALMRKYYGKLTYP